ncbi:hypothetical protein PsYK624_101750 [Phanerochaete sordida]|uniref:BTB domain-containing protein n=1 Tax=Phanerochaete sordida TaxID=48140 RepID=A0A9P3GFN6_9APHY|nr:hypothetical protein PsYK624_101750 [Phanerochaete sordida]
MVKGQIAARNHAKFYLEDGDVILQPYKDQIGGITLFCVHKGVLSFNSPVLRELFAKPPPGPKQPANNDAAIEKPLYHMKDSAQDLSEFLRAVYEPGTLLLPESAPDTPLRLAPIMKLAVKYQVASIQASVTDIMSRAWPQSLSEWLDARAQRKLLEQKYTDAMNTADNYTGMLDGKHLADRLPEPAAALRFAHDCGLHGVLPAAYYALASVPAAKDWDELQRASPDSFDDIHLRAARWSLLRPDEWRRLVRGREHLGRSVALTLEAYGRTDEFEERLGDCCRGEASALATRLRGGVLRNGAFDALLPDPIELTQQLFEAVPSWGLCTSCTDTLQGDLRFAQECLWLEIPRAFTLGQSDAVPETGEGISVAL